MKQVKILNLMNELEDLKKVKAHYENYKELTKKIPKIESEINRVCEELERLVGC